MKKQHKFRVFFDAPLPRYDQFFNNLYVQRFLIPAIFWKISSLPGVTQHHASFDDCIFINILNILFILISTVTSILALGRAFSTEFGDTS